MASLRLALLGVAVSSLPLAIFWGFSVDDAWIVTRVANCGETTGLFAFNCGGPKTDAVTPLGYAELVAGLHGWLPLGTFETARALGVACYLASWAVATQRLAKANWLSLALFCVMGLAQACAGAWAGAGLETPIAMLMVTAGAEATRQRLRGLGALLAGAGAAWRPELSLVCAFIALHGLVRREFIRPTLLLLLMPLGVVTLRYLSFGTVLPLSYFAKPVSAGDGLRYAAGGLALTGMLGALVATAKTRSAGRFLRGVIALMVFSAFFAGGDWMPFFRLFVPLVPLTVAEGARVVSGRGAAVCAGLVSALAGAALSWAMAPDARLVVETRQGWVQTSHPWLKDAAHVATVDVGWVGQATSAQIYDLSGVTEPQVARLPGGHTSHQVTAVLLDRNRVDTWIVRAYSGEPARDVQDLRAVYEVDTRLLRSADDLGFQVAHELAIPRTGTRYVILTRPKL